MTDTAGIEMKARLRAALASALKERRSRDVAVIRTLVAAIDNAEAVAVTERRGVFTRFGDGEAPRRMLRPADIDALFASELRERRAAAEQLQAHGQQERARQLMEEIAVIERLSN